MAAHGAFFSYRTVFFSVILLLLYLSQRYWFRRAWKLIGGVRRPVLGRLLRAAWVVALLLVVLGALGGVAPGYYRDFLHERGITALVSLWLSSAFLAFVAVHCVAVAEWMWGRVRRIRGRLWPAPAQPALQNPSRRYFFETATYLAGAVPFIGALYGFAAERLRYCSERVEVPIPALPRALDGLRIAQLSDIHIGGYMPREQVRRAVEMANELCADLAVVTGDFITGPSDPLEACVEELARLRAPLGVWGSNGNHEIYADAEEYTAELFHQAGMHILRQENTELVWRGQPFNLIGVDYQRERGRDGRRLLKLVGVERLVRRDAPNILLSHNPNVFPRAAELGIALTLAGHTHGGQVRVEILDHRWSPARFFTPYIAGLYCRPFCSSASERTPVDVSPPAARPPAVASAFLYVNRGLGTIGAPVRIGVPPEITLLVLRRG
ncbi:MAG TPA: metallophosphoesterase [Candidatus Acidoferrales bacterium]|nr:metallophosphoesterase [Candidatus Acidoferrales bacterium]